MRLPMLATCILFTAGLHVMQAPLWDVAARGPSAYPNNTAFVHEFTTNLLTTSFPNMRPQQVQVRYLTLTVDRQKHDRPPFCQDSIPSIVYVETCTASHVSPNRSGHVSLFLRIRWQDACIAPAILCAGVIRRLA